MALGTNHVIATEVPNFIPELWSDEVIAAYKSNLVLGGLVRKLNHRGKKGDTIKVPTPTRGAASDKTAQTQVTLQQHGTDAGLSILIDKHKEYSRLIEDLVSVQALESLRSFYTDDAGYAIAKQVDQDLWREMFNTGSASLVYTGNVLETASTFDRAMCVPTIVKFDLLGLARFTEQAFVGEVGGGNSIRNGYVGDVYGMDVYVTTNSPIVEDSSANEDNIAGVVFQADAMALVEQLGVRSQTQYKQEYLADLFTTDMIYGVKALRDSSIVTFVVPTT
jgi:hypothetical protein